MIYTYVIQDKKDSNLKYPLFLAGLATIIILAGFGFTNNALASIIQLWKMAWEIVTTLFFQSLN